jgi:hypothetical protein
LCEGSNARCRVATESDAAQGRPPGLYGNAFAAADAEVVRRATTAIDPPTITNLIAMSALPPARGNYTHEQIAYLMTTAFTGYRTAMLASRGSGDAGRVVVHTGFWGCGAFGGNRILVTAFQAIAACAAGLDRLVVHTGASDGPPSIEGARALVQELAQQLAQHSPMPFDQLIDGLVDRGYEWGQSDGN